MAVSPERIRLSMSSPGSALVTVTPAVGKLTHASDESSGLLSATMVP
jgi:hypothetical protein